MHLTRYGSASEFLQAVEAFLLRAETENSLILGVSYAMVQGAQESSSQPYFSAVWSNGEPIVAAFSNLQTRVGVTRSADPTPVALLVDDLIQAFPGLRTLGGPEPTAGLCAAAVAARAGRPYLTRRGMRIHQLEQVRWPTRQLPGELRAATADDLPRVVPWIARFLEEVGDEGDAAAMASERIRSGQLFVWDDAGPVSMAAWSGKTPNGVRVNLVFTPDDLRGRGYASATVAALSQLLLDQGNRHCCLYTDLANPISNAIYARLGYYPVSDAGLYRFA